MSSEQELSPQEIEDIEQTREERFQAENRPENAEVDNTDATLPTVERFREMTAGEDVEGEAGSSDPSKRFREMEIPQERVDEIEQTREFRLDPENRMENAEVDNSDRTFDAERGHFTDSAEYDDSAPPRFSDPEDPNNPDNQPDTDSPAEPGNSANPDWTASREED
jgi:hypothetical protein